MTDQARLDQLTVNTIRTLSMDAVQAANSGHPGTPMALAPVAYCLWQRFLRFDPDDPIWPNRDRFVLSCGHASMLIYSLLHLAGVKAVNPEYERLGELTVKLEDIKRFRQLDSKCAGHPEYRWTSGIETTTGPLGAGRGHQCGHGHRQPLAGPALQPARLRDVQLRRLRAGRRRLHDGGHLGRGRLAWPAISSSPTCAGSTTTTRSRSRATPSWAFSEDVATRFIAYGWNVTRVGDANDLEMLERAFTTFKNDEGAADADHRR